MAKYNVDFVGDEIDEIILNKYGDKIFISGDDVNLFDNFCKAYEKIEEMSNQVPKKLKELEKKYPETGEEISLKNFSEASKIRVEFCENASKIIDDIFGEGTTKKSFRNYYETIPNFLPDENKFISFFETMTPIMQDIFRKKIEKINKEKMLRKRRMEKYKPQDHKKKGKK